VPDCEFLFISVAINIARCNRVVMMGLFPRALSMSKPFLVTFYFKSCIYEGKKPDSRSRPTVSFLSTADMSDGKHPFSFLLLVPRKEVVLIHGLGVAIVSKAC